MVQKNSSIIINSKVDALIGLNEMQINDTAMTLINNSSMVFENTIQKSHKDGIVCICNSSVSSHTCKPLIQKNYIEASTHNGIVCEGEGCKPNILANIIETNRKAGIKLMDNACAHIGGHNLDDLDVGRSRLDFK